MVKGLDKLSGYPKVAPRTNKSQVKQVMLAQCSDESLSPACSTEDLTTLETECPIHSGKASLINRVAERELTCDIAYLISEVLLPPKGLEPKCEVHQNLSRQCQGLDLPKSLSLSQHPYLTVL